MKKLALPALELKDNTAFATNPVLGPFMYKSSGDSYQGQYFKGQRQGQGELVTKTGETYLGEWEADQRKGKGRLILPNGDYYEGDFLDNKANGKGIFNSEETGITYEGEFKDDRQEGKGKETHPNGAFYEGQFVGKQVLNTNGFNLIFRGQKTRNGQFYLRRWRRIYWQLHR